MGKRRVVRIWGYRALTLLRMTMGEWWEKVLLDHRLARLHPCQLPEWSQVGGECRYISFTGMNTRVLDFFREPATLMNGSSNRLHHAGGSSDEFGRPMGLHNHQNPTSFSRPSHPGSASQSRFEVHISPTTFSPILIPSATPSESATPSPPKPRDISTQGPKHEVTASERTHGMGETSMHGRSQSSMSPNETLNSPSRSRRHGISANFLESVGAVSSGMKTQWNGQSLGAGQTLHSHTPRDTPSSSPSHPTLVHPSASAPATSCLSNTDTGLNVPGLAPIHETSTNPAISSSSNGSLAGRSPLPRSAPSYNLARFTPSSSGTVTDPRHPMEVSHRLSERGHRINHHPASEASHHLQRSLAQQPSSSSPTRVSEATVDQHQSSNHNRTNPTMGSETEIGYKGLTFPLPPSNEEGLAMSFSSSQSSIFSTTAPGRRSGDQPTTPKKASDGDICGGHQYDTKTLGATEPRGVVPGSGRSVRERKASLTSSENRDSPTSNMRSERRKLDGAGNDFERAPSHTSRTDTDEERDTIMHQDRVAKELEDVLSTRGNHREHSKDAYPHSRARAISETPRPHPTSARSQKHPEPTKPLVLNPSRKTLHTTRSFTSLADQKQTLTASSTRDVGSSTVQRSERVRTATAIPLRVGPGLQRDRDGHAPVSVIPAQHWSAQDQSLTPPSLPLPTPPNSSLALNIQVETKHVDVASSRSQVGMDTPSIQPLTLTLEEVTQTLRAQRIRFDELVGHVVEMAQRNTAEKDTYVGRVGRLESTVANLEREIRGLRCLVLESTKPRAGVVSNTALVLDALATDEEKSSKCIVPWEPGGNDDTIANNRTLRRSITMPQLPTLVQRAGHARARRFGGLGLDLSPESAGSSPSTLETPSRYDVDMGDGDGHTPSMDEIIDKLMAVRQWAASDVRVSVVESTGDAGDSKRIVFRQV